MALIDLTLITTGDSFTVHNDKDFERDVLTANYRHGKFSSFQRQLNMYGFRKVADCSDRTYSHPFFLRDCPHLLVKVRRVNPKHAKNGSAKANTSSAAGTGATAQQPEAAATGRGRGEVDAVDRDQAASAKAHHDDGFGAETTGESEQGEGDKTPAARKKRRMSAAGAIAGGKPPDGGGSSTTKSGVRSEDSSAATQQPSERWAAENVVSAGVGGGESVVAARPKGRKQPNSSATADTAAEKQAKAQARARARAHAKQLKKDAQSVNAGGGGERNASKGNGVTVGKQTTVSGGGGHVGDDFASLLSQTKGAAPRQNLPASHQPHHQQRKKQSGAGKGIVADPWAMNSCMSPSTSSAASSVDSSPSLLPFVSGVGGAGGLKSGVMQSSAVVDMGADAVPPSPSASPSLVSSVRSGAAMDAYLRGSHDADNNSSDVFSASSRASSVADCTSGAMNSSGVYFGAWSSAGDATAGGGGGGGCGGAGNPQDQLPLWLDKAFGFGAALARCPSGDVAFDPNASINDDRLGSVAAASSGWPSSSDQFELTSASTAGAREGSHHSNNNSAVFVTPTAADGGSGGSRASSAEEAGSSAMDPSTWNPLASIGGGWSSQLDGASGMGAWAELPSLGENGGGNGKGPRGGMRSAMMLGGVGGGTGSKRPVGGGSSAGAGGVQHSHMRNLSTLSGLSMPGSEVSAQLDWSLLDTDASLLQEFGEMGSAGDGAFPAAVGVVGGSSRGLPGAHGRDEHSNNSTSSCSSSSGGDSNTPTQGPGGVQPYQHRRTPSLPLCSSPSAAAPFPLLAYSSELSSCSSKSVCANTAGGSSDMSASIGGGGGMRGGVDPWGMGVSTMASSTSGLMGRPSATLFS